MSMEGVYVGNDPEVVDKIDSIEDDYESRSEAIRELLRSAPTNGKRHLDAVYAVSVELSAYQATVVGNRLWKTASLYDESSPVRAETEWLARRFHTEADAAQQGDTIDVDLSEFEARVIGDRLHEAAEAYDCSHVAAETRELRDLFHGEIASRE